MKALARTIGARLGLGIAGALALAIMQPIPLAGACGYEDPSSVSVQRGLLNIVYPKALYVMGAVTQARMDGVLVEQVAAPAGKDLFGRGFRQAAEELQRFGDIIGPNAGSDEDLSFSLVLIEPVLWTRYGVRDGQVTAFVHAKGPGPNEPVVITAEAALRQMVAHRLSVRRAEELGLLRLYGDPSKLAALRLLIGLGPEG